MDNIENLNQWFVDAKKDLIANGLVIDEPVLSNKGTIVLELNFLLDELKRRMINMDETHHDLSITGDKLGSRTIILICSKAGSGLSRTLDT